MPENCDEGTPGIVAEQRSPQPAEELYGALCELQGGGTQGGED